MARSAGRWRNAACWQTTGASDMKHRHLVHEELTPAAIEDILDRGRMTDWEPLITAIEDNPHGGIAETTRKLCERPLFAAPVFRRVIEKARMPRP